MGAPMSSSKRHNVVPLPQRAPTPSAPSPADPAMLMIAGLQQQITFQQQQYAALEARVRALETEHRTTAPVASSAPAGPPENLSEHRERERAEIIAALEATGWNRIDTAKRLGMPRRTLYRRMEEYRIQEGDSRKKKPEKG